jgi:hypothetical protein
MASRRSWVRIPSAPPFEGKEVTPENPNCCQLLLPTLLFFLAFQHESFTICEERSPWRTTHSLRASTPATEDFLSSTCSSRRLTGRFPLREQLTICGQAEVRAPRSESVRISPQRMLPSCRWMTEKNPIRCAKRRCAHGLRNPLAHNGRVSLTQPESTSNAANRSHARHTLATVQPSISLPRPAKKAISMRFAGTTCSTTCSFCEQQIGKNGQTIRRVHCLQLLSQNHGISERPWNCEACRERGLDTKERLVISIL